MQESQEERQKQSRELEKTITVSEDFKVHDYPGTVERKRIITETDLGTLVVAKGEGDNYISVWGVDGLGGNIRGIRVPKDATLTITDKEGKIVEIKG